MQGLSAGLGAPPLSLSGTLREARAHTIRKVQITPGKVGVTYQDDKGNVGVANIIANDYVMKELVDNDVDVIIADIPDPGPSPLTTFLGVIIAFQVLSFVVDRVGKGGLNPFQQAQGKFEEVDNVDVTF